MGAKTMILQIDIGNSRIKWRLLDNQKAVVAAGVHATSTIVSGSSLDLQGVTSVSEIQVASVVDAKIITALKQQLEKTFSIHLKIAQVSAQAGSVTCGYKDPLQLGVDRWLAIVAAYQQFPEALLVIDAGTAITMDLVDAQGQHLGGYILPGLQLMNQSLLGGTASIDVSSDASAHSLIPGENSQQAVTRGCLLAVVAAIDKLASQQAIRVVVTGGDAQPLIDGLKEINQSGKKDKAKPALKLFHCPDLVLDGLLVPGISLV